MIVNNARVMTNILILLLLFVFLYVVYNVLVFFEVPMMYINEYMLFYALLLVLFFFMKKRTNVW